MHRTRLLLATVLAALAVAPTAGAAAASSSSTSGDVSATIAWNTAEGEFGFEEIRDVSLTITRAGTVMRDGALTIARCEEPTCRPFALVGSGSAAPAVLVRDIDADTDPEVLVGAFSGGAHCCTSLTVLDWSGSAYRQVTHDFGDGGIRIVGAAAATSFHTNDARFSYRFSSFAASWLPFRAMRFTRGAFADVTRSFPAVIRRDATRAWALARSQCRSTDEYADSLGAYAGWAANQYRLGARRAALRTLRAEQRAGCLKGTAPRTFVARLDRFLLGLR